MYIEKQMTHFHHVHDEDFEIRPNETNLIKGVLFWKKRTETRRQSSLLTIGEAVDNVIITVMFCKILIYLVRFVWP